ncbi:hypothetical protein [Nostoc sp. FACHB-110]|uniref:hypothetical protein n=1 Tax=Nostoc sp. FACHB-110 TaxID=2692834 RepID=UPI0016848CF4|nr:hypothetical protein [Nostoc sp. FACHB-110]MBD2436522.1 hypothetical protein [Nostoc sp. FACHB-110]
MIRKLITTIWRFTLVITLIIGGMIAFNSEYAVAADDAKNFQQQSFNMTNYERYCLKFPQNCTNPPNTPLPVELNPDFVNDVIGNKLQLLKLNKTQANQTLQKTKESPENQIQEQSK